MNTSPALHSSAHAPTRRAGVTTDAPGSRPSRGSRWLPGGRRKPLDSSFPVHAAGSSAGRAHLPAARLGRCTSPGPSPPPRSRGSQQRGVPRPLTCGCPSAALLRLGTCPGQERIARRKRQHMSHPRSPGSEEEIPRGRDEAPGRSPRVPRNARFPEAKGGPAALPCREGLSRLLRRGEGWELRAVCPQLLQGCSAQPEGPPRLPCTHLPLLQSAEALGVPACSTGSLSAERRPL